ncbi:MAG: SPFH domain-containing protein [Ignavibacteriales bacterium]|nr:MAG: SPFH domain-containing protein [Ignavibacteriaceae bacterium]MBW7873191.1 SPFH domain-containing protein [Ignavibacteria bacterium]MCZ2142833.1 SPFH domain-containing protein [Ignavibacteriales bacterium]MBV6443927.1 hypothetical protein [Ignavibacteriaceae bacterium]MBZ0196230.1 SPFH domain-containing protein [Ignavibacteriaceae bacterium]
MAVIDFVKWDPGSAPVYAWKFPHSNLSTYTQLVVSESQEAVLFSNGQLISKFGPGKHTLDTENIPVLRSLFGLPFGGKNPFAAEVWFVNKLLPLNIDWSIDSMMTHDPDYQTMVPLVASGRYGLKITDAERFLIKLVGTATEFTAFQLTDHFWGLLTSKTKSILLQFINSQRIGIKNISAFLDPLSTALKNPISVFWEDYGISLIDFYLTTVEVDANSEVGQRILEAMSRQSAQAIGGYTWQQSKAFEIADDAVNQMGSGQGGLMGAVLATGLMGNLSGAGLMQPQPTQGNNVQPPGAGQYPPGVPGAAGVREVFCSNCAKKYPSNMKFCPHCGDPYTPCPSCGADNDKSAKRCVSCGVPLASAAAKCNSCGADIPGNAAFCPNCGQPAVIPDGICKKCGTNMGGAKFCPNCGTKRE